MASMLLPMFFDIFSPRRLPGCLSGEVTLLDCISSLKFQGGIVSA